MAGSHFALQPASFAWTAGGVVPDASIERLSTLQPDSDCSAAFDAPTCWKNVNAGRDSPILKLCAYGAALPDVSTEPRAPSSRYGSDFASAIVVTSALCSLPEM